MPDAFVDKRVRKNQKFVTFAAGGSDYIPMAGPFNAIIWSIKGTTDAHTIDWYGIERALRRVTINSNKRGLLADIDGITLYRYSLAIFNTGYKADTVGGAAIDGIGGILPLGADVDELITFQVDFGSLTDIASTADLLGYTGILRTSVLLLNRPMAETYWAYRNQILGASGVIGGAATYQQPPPPIVPGFYLTGELFTTETTSLTTAVAMALDEIRITQADDYLVDDFVIQLQLYENSRRYFGGQAALGADLLTRHLPVVTSDITQITVVNGATATIYPSKLMYVYIGGKIQGGARPAVNEPTPMVETPQGSAGAPLPQPRRSVSPVGGVQPSSAYRSSGTISDLMRR